VAWMAFECTTAVMLLVVAWGKDGLCPMWCKSLVRFSNVLSHVNLQWCSSIRRLNLRSTVGSIEPLSLYITLSCSRSRLELPSLTYRQIRISRYPLFAYRLMTVLPVLPLMGFTNRMPSYNAHTSPYPPAYHRRRSGRDSHLPSLLPTRQFPGVLVPLPRRGKLYCTQDAPER
jgi:hypothetical protein